MDLAHLYTSFQGRISRQPFWIGLIVLIVTALLAVLAIGALVGVSMFATDSRFKLLKFALLIVFLYPAAALLIKRLHDRNRPNWFASFFLVPTIAYGLTELAGITGNGPGSNALDYLVGTVQLAAAIWLVIEPGILRGTVGPNQYGPDPLEGRM